MFGTGKEDYAREELVAEITSALLMARLGLSSEPREDHAQYLANWMKAIREDAGVLQAALGASSKALKVLEEAAGNAATVELETAAA